MLKTPNNRFIYLLGVSFISLEMQCAQSLSHVQLFGTPWIILFQDPLSMGFFQARILEWVAISFSRVSSQPRDRTLISYIGRQILYHWAPGKPIHMNIIEIYSVERRDSFAVFYKCQMHHYSLFACVIYCMSIMSQLLFHLLRCGIYNLYFLLAGFVLNSL